jgi:formylglycine-generating enzyme required for sulfatase activity
MSGNAWEWCSDWFRADYYRFSPSENPQGPSCSIDPDGRNEPKRVMRGGSFLCSDNYCIRYMAGARHHGAPDTGLMHNGFRCVKSAR